MECAHANCIFFLDSLTVLCIYLMIKPSDYKVFLQKSIAELNDKDRFFPATVSVSYCYKITYKRLQVSKLLVTLLHKKL